MKPISKFIAIAAVVAGLAGTLYYGASSKKQAPAVSYVSIKGEQTSQQALQGKVVLVNFWYPSCPGCVKEMPKLVQTYHKYQAQGFRIVAVTLNYDPPQTVQAFVDRFQLPFFIALDSDGRIAKQFGDVQLAPTSFLIDKKGRILQRYMGEPDFAVLHKLIEEKLAEPV